MEALGLELFEISAAAHQGTRELVKRPPRSWPSCPLWRCMSPPMWSAPEVDTSGEVSIEKFDDTWVVEAPGSSI